MPRFSKQSLTRLQQAHPDLQNIFLEVIQITDCSILCSHRGELEQRQAFQTKRSKLQWPNSKHNSLPSLAVDVAPYPIDWDDIDRFKLFAGTVLQISKNLGIPIRWGGDWNRDGNSGDENFLDWVHFELFT